MQTRAWSIMLLAILIINGCASDESPVGVYDCQVIKNAVKDPLTAEACERCQLASCQLEGCGGFPCVEGKRLVRGCVSDEDCSDLTGARCGRHSAPDGVCTLLGDDL